MDWTADTVKLTRRELDLHSDKLFSKDDYLKKSYEDSLKERILFLNEEISRLNLHFKKERGFDGQEIQGYYRNSVNEIGPKDFERVLKKVPENLIKKEEDNIPF